MTANINSILLAGPLSNIKISESQWGLQARAVLAGINIKINGKEKDKERIIPQLDKFQAAVLFDGTINSVQDKNDAAKIWHSVDVSSSRIIPVQTQVPVINVAQIVGKVVQVTDNWLTVAASYQNKKTQEWKDRYMYVLGLSNMAHAQGKDILVTGRVSPKHNGTWFMHVEADTILLLS